MQVLIQEHQHTQVLTQELTQVIIQVHTPAIQFKVQAQQPVR